MKQTIGSEWKHKCLFSSSPEFQFVLTLKIGRAWKPLYALADMDDALSEQLGVHTDVKVTSTRHHSAKVLYTTVRNSSVAMVTDLRSHWHLLQQMVYVMLCLNYVR